MPKHRNNPKKDRAARRRVRLLNDPKYSTGFDDGWQAAARSAEMIGKRCGAAEYLVPDDDDDATEYVIVNDRTKATEDAIIDVLLAATGTEAGLERTDRAVAWDVIDTIVRRHNLTVPQYDAEQFADAIEDVVASWRVPVLALAYEAAEDDTLIPRVHASVAAFIKAVDDALLEVCERVQTDRTPGGAS